MENEQKPCICEINDPCDYHIATCVVCPDRKCKGHPNKKSCKWCKNAFVSPFELCGKCREEREANDSYNMAR